MIELQTFFAGLLYMVAGLCGLTRHFLLHPTVPEGTPRPPKWLLGVVFGFSVVMIYSGLRYLTAWYIGEATTVPPGVTGYGVFIALTLAMYKVSMLTDTIMRKPVWTLTDLAKELKKG